MRGGSIAVPEWRCLICEGAGCEECDGTGRRVRTHLDAGDGATLSVSSSAPLTPETRDALVLLVRAAMTKMDHKGEED